MRFRVRRKPKTRAELIERKHRLAGEIRSLEAERRQLAARNQPTGGVESRLDQLRNDHYRTRQEIDRADP